MVRVILIFAVSVAVGCRSESSAVKTDRFVEVQGSTGKLVVPSQWQLEDEDAHWSVTSADGRAVINISTFTVEGSGSLQNVAQVVADNLTDPKPLWQPSEWTPLQVQGRAAIRRSLKSMDAEAKIQWVVIALQEGELYHVLSLNAAGPIMELNGEFYESIMLTFKGIDAPPKRSEPPPM